MREFSLKIHINLRKQKLTIIGSDYNTTQNPIGILNSFVGPTVDQAAEAQ